MIPALGQGRWADPSTLYLTGLKGQSVSAEQIIPVVSKSYRQTLCLFSLGPTPLFHSFALDTKEAPSVSRLFSSSALDWVKQDACGWGRMAGGKEESQEGSKCITMTAQLPSVPVHLAGGLSTSSLHSHPAPSSSQS